jgi:2,4-diketo-3-deoxy-L-fuconate hydrolase
MTQVYALGSFLKSDGEPWPGVVCQGKVAPLSEIVAGVPATLYEVVTNWDVWRDQIHAAMRGADYSGWADEGSVEPQLPFMPDNLFGVGANFRKHVIEMIVDAGAGGTEHLSPAERRAFGEAEMDRRAESGKPFAWVGLRSSIAGPDQTLVLPHDMTQPDWELELAVVMGRTARRVSAAEAFDYIAGYTIANDVTARELVMRPDLKNLGMDWMACKGAPGFKIIGPYITPTRFVADPQKLHINLSLNGQMMQDEGTDDMIFGVARIVEFISAHCELRPGDVIMTGSPSGNGTHYNRYLRGGDEMVGRIEGLVGEQRTRCVAEPAG